MSHETGSKFLRVECCWWRLSTKRSAYNDRGCKRINTEEGNDDDRGSVR